MSDNKVMLIEGKIDQEQTGAIQISSKVGGVSFESIGDMMAFSKLMAVSDKAVPAYLRGNVGSCLAITVQANEWGLSPFAVARMSFVVNDVIGYMSQLLHAVVERRAPLKERLRFRFEGEGPTKKVFVSGHIKGEVDPLVYESPMFSEIKVKNSPLWFSDVEQQFTYYGARAWARRFVPDILLGIYSKEELEDSHIGADNAKDVSPPANEGLHHRLSSKAVAGAGFDPDKIAKTIDGDDKPSTDAGAPTSAAAAEAQGSPSPSPAAANSSAAPPAVEVTDAEPVAPAADSASNQSIESSDSGPSEVKAAATESTPSQAVAAAELPAEPKDGKDYLPYTLAMLATFESEASVRMFWKSGIKLRNGLPNLSSEDIVAAEKAKNARIAELKG